MNIKQAKDNRIEKALADCCSETSVGNVGAISVEFLFR